MMTELKLVSLLQAIMERQVMVELDATRFVPLRTTCDLDARTGGGIEQRIREDLETKEKVTTKMK